MIIRYIGSIASSIKKQKNNQIDRVLKSNKNTYSSASKEQHLKWYKEGKCQVCGGEEGECKGICDECRLS